VLGVTSSISNDELKSRYRTLVTEYHPDALIARGVPTEFVTLATKKLAAINGAYHTIAKERRI
jgi:DnaJ like chaperone protein